MWNDDIVGGRVRGRMMIYVGKLFAYRRHLVPRGGILARGGSGGTSVKDGSLNWEIMYIVYEIYEMKYQIYTAIRTVTNHEPILCFSVMNRSYNCHCKSMTVKT